MKKYLITTTALAGAFAIGITGAPLAQSVNPNSPGSAAGGMMAQGGTSQPGAGTMQQGTMQPGGMQPGTMQPGTMQPGGMMRPGSTMGQAGTGQGGMMRPGTTTSARASMNEQQIRGILTARGYSDISGMEQDGDHFKVSQAKRYGRDVEDLRINARTGQVQDEQELNADQARHLLEQRGYSDVSDVSRDGNTITAKAKRDGREMTVRIDTGTSAVMPMAANMNEEQIRGILSARGYTDISGLERDGDHFKVSGAKRFGRDVEGLRINARNGQVQDETRLNEDQARKLLEERGYSEVSDVSPDGDTITAKAKRNNRTMDLRIDARSGVVMPQLSSN